MKVGAVHYCIVTIQKIDPSGRCVKKLKTLNEWESLFLKLSQKKTRNHCSYELTLKNQYQFSFLTRFAIKKDPPYTIHLAGIFVKTYE